MKLGLSALCRFIPAWAFETQGQTLLVVESINAFVIIPPALPPEHNLNPAIAIVDPGFGDLSDTKTQRTLVWRYRTVAERAAAYL
ncbi:hypothetical protein YA52_00370 [Enterobacter roggenkampii]|nr:hypothetical protein YA52_00370 [Enterobacter roggenkampii]